MRRHERSEKWYLGIGLLLEIAKGSVKRTPLNAGRQVLSVGSDYPSMAKTTRETCPQFR